MPDNLIQSVRLEERLGYVHRGVERLMQGKSVAEAARLASRVSWVLGATYVCWWAFGNELLSINTMSGNAVSGSPSSPWRSAS